jgi:hypothetical protein
MKSDGPCHEVDRRRNQTAVLSSQNTGGGTGASHQKGGAQLRGMMPFLDPVTIKPGQQG